jgi:hypothetical protein
LISAEEALARADQKDRAATLCEMTQLNTRSQCNDKTLKSESAGREEVSSFQMLSFPSCFRRSSVSSI